MNCDVRLTLKTLGTVTVSLVDSPLAEMTVTVGLDMVAMVDVVLWLVVANVEVLPRRTTISKIPCVA